MANTTRPKNEREKRRENPSERKKALTVRRQIKIQRALYEIASAASTFTDMQSFYGRLHEIVGGLMYAKNFFIATYDPQSDLITWQFYVDTVDVTPHPPIPLSRQRGSTGWILRHGETLADVDGSVARAMKSGEIELVGTVSDGIGVPLKSENKTIGALVVQSYEKEVQYALEDIEILTFVAQHISTALARVRAIEETRQRNIELQVINSVQEGLASNLDIQSIYTLVGDKLREIFAADTTFIAFRDDAKNVLHVHYYADRKLRRSFSRPYGTGIAEVIIESGHALLLGNELEQKEYGALHVVSPSAEKDLNQSVLGVPIFREGKAHGVVTVQSYKVNAFDENGLRLLQTLVNSMSVALENARLFNETQQRNAELAIINSVQEGLAGKLDIQAIYELVGEKIRKTFNAQVVNIVTYDRATQLMHGRYYFENEKVWAGITLPAFGFRKHVIETCQPMVINKDMPRWIEEYDNPIIQGEQSKSAVFIPMIVGNEALGVISLQNNDQENAFPEADVRLLTTLANSMSVALENARLFQETQRLFHAEQQAHEQAETLRSVAQALNRSLSLTEVFQLVLIEIQKVIPYDSAGIYQVHGNRRVFVAGCGFANLEDLIGVSFEFNQQEDEIGYVISKSLQPLILEDAPETYPQYFGSGRHAATQIRSYMAVPIVLNQKLIGMITLDRKERGFYTAEQAGLAMAFAAQAATAIHNAQLFDEAQQRNAELAIINSVQEGLASKLELQAIYELVGDKIRDVFDAQAVMIVSYDHVLKAIDFNYIFETGKRSFADPIPFTQMTRQLIHKREFVLINEGLEQHFLKYGIHPAPGTSLGKSAVWMPLIVDNSVRGVINLYNLDHEYAFSESDVRLLQTLANSMSVALENARLWDQEKKYRKSLQRELEIGREIQTGFLPEELPVVEGWEIAASLLPAREVAGDFYDAFELPDGNLGLVIADVCDKGVGAALFMTLFRSLIRITANQDYFDRKESAGASYFTAGRLQRAIMLTNNYIAETHQASGMFATLFFGILDPRAGRLMYINGGHEPPLVIQSGQVRESLCKTGSAVGAIRDGHFDVRIVELKPGDTLFAFTDGALEAKDLRGEFFGRERLFQILRRCSDSSHELIPTIEAELHQYMDGTTQFDDITLLAVRRVR